MKYIGDLKSKISKKIKTLFIKMEVNYTLIHEGPSSTTRYY